MDRDLFLIGGAPSLKNLATLLQLTAKKRGTDKPHIALVAHAAADPQTQGRLSAEDFETLGAEVSLLLPGKQNVFPNKVDAIYMMGGVQTRLMEKLCKDGLIAQITRLCDQGVIVAGNSAGTAAASERMISGGMYDTTLIACGQLQYATGLGLVGRVVFDTHIDCYHRERRLLAIAAENPGHLVIGIDEATAVRIEGKRATVHGYTHVILVHAGSDFSTDLRECSDKEGRTIRNLSLSSLSDGDTFELP